MEDDLYQEEYSDEDVQYAPDFEPRDIVLGNEEDIDLFNTFCSQIQHEVLNLVEPIKNLPLENTDLFNVFKNHDNSEKSNRKTLIKRATATWAFLSEKKTKKKKSKDNRLLFSKWITYVCTHLVYGIIFDQPTRISHKSNDYNGCGYYAKYALNYNVIMFMYDALALLDYVLLDLGSVTKEKTTRVYITPLMEKVVEPILSGDVRFKDIKFYNKRGHQYDLVRLNALKINDNSILSEKKKESKDKPNTKKTIRLEIERFFKDHDRFRRDYLNKEKQVSTINDSLDKINVDARIDEDIVIRSKNLLDLLYSYYKNCYIDNLRLECTINESNITEIKYLTDLVRINNININVATDDKYILRGVSSACIPFYLVRNGAFSRNISDIDNIYLPLNKSNTKIEIHIHHLSFTIQKKDLHRVFSRADMNKPKLNKHGRFYGGAWINLSKKIRNHLYINNSTSPLVSLDYSALHLRMCYHLEGKEYNGDPYKVEGYPLIEHRKWFKTISMITLNIKDKSKALYTIMKTLEKDFDQEFTEKYVKILMCAFEQHHDAEIVDKYFYNDFAVDGMFYDSNILEKCLLALMVNQGIPVLPEHDELLCNEEDYKAVVAHMVGAYMKEFRPMWLKKEIITKDQDYLSGLYPMIKKNGVELPFNEIPSPQTSKTYH